MIPEEVLEVFNTLFYVERRKLDDAMAAEMQAKSRQYSSTGNLNSSAAAQGYVKVAVDTIPARVQAAFIILLRSLSAHGLSPVAENKAALAGLIGDRLDHQIDEMAKVIHDMPVFQSGPASKSEDRFLAGLKKGAELEMRRIDGELTLLVAAAARSVPTTGGQSMVFNAPVGMVQTGPGSMGVVNQSLDAGTVAELGKALDIVRSMLAEGEAADADLLEVVDDAKAEMAKSKPNISKLRGLVTGVGQAIAFVPKFKDAYETFKWAAGYVGVNLP